MCIRDRYRLLKQVAGFCTRQQSVTVASVSGEEDLLGKQCVYVRCVVQLVCRSATQPSCQQHSLLSALSAVVGGLANELHDVIIASELSHLTDDGR